MGRFRLLRRSVVALLTGPNLWISHINESSLESFGAFFSPCESFQTISSSEAPAETSTFPGPCTRTTLGTSTRRPAAAAPLRSSQTPSQVAAARSEVRSLPQATRYRRTIASHPISSVCARHLSPMCMLAPSAFISGVAWRGKMDPVTQIAFVFSRRES